MVALNIRASIQAHRAQSELRPLPVDLFIMFTGYVGVVYLHNYVLKVSERFDPRLIIWDLFTACGYRHHDRVGHHLLAAGR